MKNIFTTLTIILILSNLSCNSIDNSLKITEDQGENITISRKWDLSNWSISIDVNSAHVSYKNNGTFVTSIQGEQVTTNPVWLESGYLVLENDELKIKYFQSEEVSDYLSK